MPGFASRMFAVQGRLTGGKPAPGVLRFLAVESLPRDGLSSRHQRWPPAGSATVDYVAAALDFVHAAAMHAAIVACPHSEANVNAAGIPFLGLPEPAGAAQATFRRTKSS